ncbi:MAG TPA: OsmC family protein, partial [Rudaea sp.]|nr:OsmC family protein [Rudaea sp.]
SQYESSVRAHEATDMTMQDIATALRRAEKVFERRPQIGLHDDASATARWQGGTRVVSSHANGTEVATDMPAELGGTGDHVTPGWLFRAGLASCAATSIVMTAAAEEIELASLEVFASSRSDTRALLGMSDADGRLVPPGPSDLKLRVRICAQGVEPARLRALVEEGCRRSPIPNAVLNAVPMALHIDVGAA